MSDSESSDEGFNFSKLRKQKKETFKKKQHVKSASSSPSKLIPMPSKPKEEADDVICLDNTGGEECDTLEKIMETTKRINRRVKPVDSDIEEIDVSSDDGAVLHGYKRPRRVKRDVNYAPYSGQERRPLLFAELIEKETESLKQRLAAARRRDQDKLDRIENEVFDDDVQEVTLTLRIMLDDSFIKIFKIPRTEQFAEKVFLLHALNAGFEDPESFDIIWEYKDGITIIKFYDTPNSVGMPLDQPSHLLITPKEGVIRQERKDGEIKLKFIVKDVAEPIEAYIPKEKTFGEFVKEFALEHKLKARQTHFAFDGERVDPSETPASLDMEDFDMVDVIQT